MKKLLISNAVAKCDNSGHSIHITALSTPTQLSFKVIVITLIWIFRPLAENLKSEIARRIPSRPVKKIHSFFTVSFEFPAITAVF
jgi:hypothetical protein